MTARSHEEIQELLGAYALHAVDADEAELVEQHLEGCPRCRSEVAGHREVASLLGNTGGDAPDGLWDRIASQLEEEPPPLRLPPGTEGDVVPLAPRRARPRRLVAAALGAAAALVIGILATQVVRQDQRIGELEAAMDGTSITDASVASLASSDGQVSAEAVVLASGTGYLLTGDLPPLGEDQTYQLWGVTDRGTTVSLGVLGAVPGAVVPFQAGDPDDVAGLAVTQEVAGGVEQSQNTPVVQGTLS